MPKRKKKFLEKNKNIITLAVFLTGIVLVVFIFARQQTNNTTYTVIEDWGVKFIDNNKRFAYEIDYLYYGAAAIYDTELPEDRCTNSINVAYHRLRTSDVEKSDTKKLDGFELLYKDDEYSIYLDKEAIPDLCGENHQKAQTDFDTKLYKL